ASTTTLRCMGTPHQSDAARCFRPHGRVCVTKPSSLLIRSLADEPPMTRTSARAPYLGPARRREPVLDAALAVFTEGGFDAASMAAIAERAEVAKPVLYDCFPGGKQELWLGVLEREER